MEWTRKSILRLLVGGIMLHSGMLSELAPSSSRGVPACVATILLCRGLGAFPSLYSLPGSTVAFLRTFGGLTVWVFLLREVVPPIASGLAATFLFPGGLPSFFFGVCGIFSAVAAVSSVVISSSRGPSLSITGILGEDATWISYGGPNLLDRGKRIWGPAELWVCGDTGESSVGSLPAREALTI